MKRGAIGVIVAVVAVGAIVAVVVTHGKKDDTNKANKSNNMANMKNMSSNGASNQSSNEGATAPASSSVEAEIAGFSFKPASLTVKKGTKVTWTNKDSTAHNVVSDSSDGPKSDTLEQGDSYSFTFNAVGTFNYICTFHPNMTAKVVVTE